MPEYAYNSTPFMQSTSHYDARRADFAVNFIQMLKHTTGEWYGKNFKLLPWQEQIVRDIFGVVDKITGYRQFREVYIELPKKEVRVSLRRQLRCICCSLTAKPEPRFTRVRRT
jgi:hypothetical protein